jgi:hypothetical protein
MLDVLQRNDPRQTMRRIRKSENAKQHQQRAATGRHEITKAA